MRALRKWNWIRAAALAAGLAMGLAGAMLAPARGFGRSAGSGAVGGGPGKPEHDGLGITISAGHRGSAVYTVTVSNTGNADATDVTTIAPFSPRTRSLSGPTRLWWRSCRRRGAAP
jgi:hypothetical protein